MNRFGKAFQDFGLTISLKKTRVMAQNVDSLSNITILEHELEVVNDFVSLILFLWIPSVEGTINSELVFPATQGAVREQLGTLRSNDADGIENVQKTIGFYKKNNHFARASHFFVHFFARFCTTTTWKCLIWRFMEYVNKQRRNFISLSELGYGL